MGTVLLGRITLNPNVWHGKPTVRNTRYLVEGLLEYLAAGDSIEEVLEEFDMMSKMSLMPEAQVETDSKIELQSTSPENKTKLKKSIKLPTGATVPDAFLKIIKYNGITEKYYFLNEKPKSSNFKLYIVK